VTYNRLAKLTGNQFDGAFAKDMVADHKSDIKAFEKESTKNDAASSYAKETLPTLRRPSKQRSPCNRQPLAVALAKLMR
jgi:predicted outer membrane protein